LWRGAKDGRDRWRARDRRIRGGGRRALWTRDAPFAEYRGDSATNASNGTAGTRRAARFDASVQALAIIYSAPLAVLRLRVLTLLRSAGRVSICTKQISNIFRDNPMFLLTITP
jgi:hypothetical protein